MQLKQKLLVLPTVQNIDEIIQDISTPIELTKGKYKNLEFRFRNNEISIYLSGNDIKEFSNVWLSSRWGSRDLAYAVMLYLKHFNIGHTYVEKVISKITDQTLFTLNNIATPDTFFVNTFDITEYIETIEEVCGYPLIVKDITGSHGKNSVLVNNRYELVEKSAKLSKRKKYLYQKYIPNDYDWGVLVSNGEIVSAEKSYPSVGEFRNNCNGATEIFVEIDSIPEDIKKIALDASAILNLPWSRSDIIVDKNSGESYLMEVNRCPGITSGTTEVSGALCFLESQLSLNA